jgi:hypothetical protein
MKISDIRIGGQVTTETGRIGQVTSAHEDGAVYVRFGSDYPEPAQASVLEHFAPDACESCKQIVDSYQEGRRDEYREQREKIEAARLKAFWDGKAAGCKEAEAGQGKLNEAIEYWQTACHSARRDAAYWHEELDKLQNDALAYCKPLAEVAKIYIQISPAILAQIMREE